MKKPAVRKRKIANSEQSYICRPFLKWVGGKGQLLPELISRMPKKIDRYFEPFVGGGALFFNLQPTKAILSDANPELINLYEVVRDNVEALIKDLKKHKYAEKYFYKIRSADRTAAYKKWSPLKRASRLIYLNKTCFNGLYRVNSSGFFNTPFGRYTNPTIVDEKNLRACSVALQKVKIQVGGFESIERLVKKNDFVYFDPPYVPLSNTSAFTSYGKHGFDLRMQRSLFDLCCRLDKRGIKFMLSNSSAPFIRKLYKQFRVELVDATRSINSKATKRGAIKEVIVTNY